MAKCIVFGGNGFIGSHLVDQLVSEGHEVTCFDRFSDDHTQYESPGVNKFAGDIMNQYDIDKALQDQEYVFHFVSTTTPATAENDPTLDIKTNIIASVELFEKCVKHKIKRVFFASTGGAIYGEQQEGQVKETDPTWPFSPYAIGKLTIENYLRYFYKKFQLDYTVVRISNPYGTRQGLNKKQGVIPIFLRNLVEDLPLVVYGDGEMVRDYIYVKDAVRMISAIMQKPAKYHIYNIGAGEGHTINDLIARIEAVTGHKPKVTSTEAPSTFVKKVVLDTNRFVNEFNLSPSTSLDEGIQETWKEIVQQYEEQ